MVILTKPPITIPAPQANSNRRLCYIKAHDSLVSHGLDGNAGLAPARFCARCHGRSVARPVADAFLVAFQLVNVVRRLLTEGALNNALVPTWLAVKETKGLLAASAFA